jgi:hypothetical protein
MPYKIVAFQNCSNFPDAKGQIEQPAIKVTISEPNWQDCYERWINMQNPTDSPLWKKGVFAICAPK